VLASFTFLGIAMKKVNLDTAFDFSHDGMRVVRYEAGEQELPDDAADFAIAHKFGSPADPVAEKTVKAKAK
jgi:hypothetical protein